MSRDKVQFSYDHSFTSEGQPKVHGVISAQTTVSLNDGEKVNLTFQSASSRDNLAELLQKVGALSEFRLNTWSTRIECEMPYKTIFIHKDDADKASSSNVIGYVNVGVNHCQNLLEFGMCIKEYQDDGVFVPMVFAGAMDYFKDAKSKGLLPQYDFVFVTLSPTNIIAESLKQGAELLSDDQIRIIESLSDIEELLEYTIPDTKNGPRFRDNEKGLLEEKTGSATDENGGWSLKVAYLMPLDSQDVVELAGDVQESLNLA